MNQKILFLRSNTPYASKELALAGISNLTTHKAGQPVVAFYEETVNSVKTTKLVFAIGNGEGQGKYNLISTESDYTELVALLEAHVENFETHIDTAANGNNLGHVKTSDYVKFTNGLGELVDNSTDLKKLKQIASKTILGNVSSSAGDVAALSSSEVYNIIKLSIANDFNISLEDEVSIEIEDNEYAKGVGITVSVAGNDKDFYILGTNGLISYLSGSSVVFDVDSNNLQAGSAKRLSDNRRFKLSGDDYIKPSNENGVVFNGTQDVTLGLSLDTDTLFASPDLTGVPTAPTAATTDSSNQIATTSFVKSVVDGLDLTEVKEVGKPIIAVSQANGKVSATAGTITATNVTIADSGNNFSASNVEAALAELYGNSRVTMESSDVKDGDFVTAKKYVFKQNGAEIGSINVAKDLVVNKGELVEKDGKKYIVLELNDKAKTKIEVEVTDLVDTYTGSGAISISNEGVVSLAVDGPLQVVSNKLGIKLGTSVCLGDANALEVKTTGVLSTVAEGITLNIGNGLEKNSSNALTIKSKSTNPGITVDSDGVAVKVKTNSGIGVDSDGISVKVKSKSGISVDSNGLYANINTTDLAFNQTTGKIELSGTIKSAIDAWKDATVNNKKLSDNPVLGAADLLYVTGTSVKSELDYLDGSVGYTKVSGSDGTKKYLVDKILSGDSNTSTNTYGVTVTEHAVSTENRALKLTVKIDTIDGGTF